MPPTRQRPAHFYLTKELFSKHFTLSTVRNVSYPDPTSARNATSVFSSHPVSTNSVIRASSVATSAGASNGTATSSSGGGGGDGSGIDNSANVNGTGAIGANTISGASGTPSQTWLMMNQIRSISWNRSSSLVATGGAGTLRVWNPERSNAKYSTELRGIMNPTTAAPTTTNSTSSTSAGTGTASVVALTSSSSAPPPVEKCAFHPLHDNELASIRSDGLVQLWDVRTRRCVGELRNLGDLSCLSWAPDGSTLVVGSSTSTSDDVGNHCLHVVDPRRMQSADDPAKLSWSLAKTKEQNLEAKANHVAFCWGGEKVFVAMEGGMTRILKYPSLEPRYPRDFIADGDSDFMLKGHTDSCSAAELSPTGRYLATGGTDSIISLWDTRDWICRRTITTIPGPISTLSFTHEGSYIVGGTTEGSGIDVYHVESGDLVHTFKTAGASHVVAWAPNRYVLAYSDLGTLRTVGLESSSK